MTFDPRPPNVHLIVLSSESRHSALGHVGSRVANQAVSVRRAGRSIFSGSLSKPDRHASSQLVVPDLKRYRDITSQF